MKQNTFITTLSGPLAILGWSEEGPEPVSVKLIASQSALMTALSWWRAFFREMLTKISRWAWPAKRTHLYP